MKITKRIFFFLLIIDLCALTVLAGETKWVTVEGTASLENITKVEARRMAIDNARRNAIERVVGVDLISETLVINNRVSGDIVCIIPHGRIIDEEILQENVELSPSIEKTAAQYINYKVKMRILVAKEQGKADPFFSVKAEINRNVFKAGDQIELRITPTKDAYISVFNILEDETALIIVPNRFRKNNFVRANSTLVFPDENDIKRGITLEAFIGEGKRDTKEMFHIIALKEPMKFETAKFSEGVFGIYNGRSGLVYDLVKETVGIPLSQRAETFIHYHIMK